ncbi:MAG: ABC transporter ATP-binding protein [Cyclobacteriaceae bacterium]|nr:ABC transporter ATP-binding protein [Cyclobacteriaceae bacterium]MCH8516016.1 ABC transporter ATP-binding protein [Cyclobacteriaceae bacterium]
MNILSLEGVEKRYQSASGADLTILSDVNLSLVAGDSLSLVGPSGSGKTTLLGLCAGLDIVTSGSIALLGNKLESLTEDQLADLRKEGVGFIFQNFQLLPTLTAIENVMVPMELKGMSGIYERAKELLKEVRLEDRIHHYPDQLSGGEQQRVAIARAFANDPKILFADEPTGNLDTETGQLIEELLFAMNKNQGTTLVLVTHDPELAMKANRQIQIKGGKLVGG